MGVKVATDDYLSAIKHRRTVYPLNDQSPVSDERIIHLVEEVALTTPSSYNIQTGRFTILLGAQHKKLWDLILEKCVPLLREAAGDELAKMMEDRVKLFRGAHGSVLFWEDNAALQLAGQQHPHAAQKLPQFSEHASAMAQIQVWTALELEGLGANLQHIAGFPGAEEVVRAEWKIPAEWSLKANMNFGGLMSEYPARPDKYPLEKTVAVYR